MKFSAKKKIIPAIAMLLVSIISLTTASYAWFSMNTTVTATGMTVTAKSNATYLLIGTADNSTSKTDSADTKAATTPSATLYPAGYNEGTENLAVGSYDAPAASWFTASNGNSDDANDDVKNGKLIENTNTNYVLTNTFYLTLSEDSEAYTGDMKVTFTRETGDPAISAVVVIQGHTYDFTTTADNQFTVTASTLTSTTTIPVNVYTYVNGDSDNVNSDYFNTEGNSITGKISLAFDLVPTVVGP